MKAPDTISLKVCPECGRNDRSYPFTGKSHSHAGKKCGGQPETWTYVRTDNP